MPRICYVEKDFTDDHWEVIEHANRIIEEYQAQGHTMTLRQLYYQLVARDLIANQPKEYMRLGVIIKHARMAGLVDWEAIIDRGRALRTQPSWTGPAHIMDEAAAGYHEDRWADQAYRPEVWIEKDALLGVIEGVCIELDVPYFACRGYNSASAAWGAAQRFDRYRADEYVPIVLHLGDHDPSGIDMTRDNAERLAIMQGVGNAAEVRRLALNYDQIEKHRPPPNPTKLTDSRARPYIARYGYDSWELDALPPQVIVDLIRVAVDGLIEDHAAWDAVETREVARRTLLQTAADRWDDVTEFLAR